MIENLIGKTDIFPILKNHLFFNHAGVSPLPKPAADELHRFAIESHQHSYIGATWFNRIDSTRELFAKTLNASTDEIAFMGNTSEGLSIIAAGLTWRPNDRIIVPGIEYPSNYYPWHDLAQRHNLQLVSIPPVTRPDGTIEIPLDAILKEIENPQTRLVAISHVQFSTGQRIDLAAIGAACRAKGKFLCVDAIQSLGALPVDVKAMNIDFLASGGHKWLLGAEGAGILYVRKELQDQVRPLIIGWSNVAEPDNYDVYDFTLKPNAGRYEAGTQNVPGLLALGASLRMLNDAQIPNVARQLKYLTDQFIEALVKKGYTIASPRENNQWSGIVSFIKPNVPLYDLVRDLRKKHNTEIVVRGGRLRVAPHFYTPADHLDQLAELLP